MMFKSIYIWNFMSIEQAMFNFQDGKTLITGWNFDDSTSEGSGKSALLNSLCWCLFGKLPRPGSKIDDVVREGTDFCGVKVVLEDGTEIDRSRNPNGLVIRKDTEVRGKDMKDTQKLIEELIGFSFETFCQSVYFPQNYPKKFITATEEEKAKILSEIQDLSVFDRARKKSLERLKAINEQELHNSTIIETTSAHLQSLINNYKGLEELRDNFNFNKQRELAEIELTLKQKKADKDMLQKKVLSLARATPPNEAIKRISEIDEKLTELHGKRHRYESEKQLKTQLKEQIEANNKRSEELLKEQTASSCPTCGQSIGNASYYNEHIESEFRKLTTENAELNLKYSNIVLLNDATVEAELETLNAEKSKLEDKIDQYKSFKQDLAVSQTELKMLESVITDSEARYTELYNQKPNDVLFKIKQAADEIEDVTQYLKQTKFRLETSKKDKSVYSTLKEGFKEVKSYVFQNCLVELNNLANRYVTDLFEQPVNIKFYNQEEGEGVAKIKVDVTLDGNTRPLSMYSGGQFRRIQIAVDLALSDVVSSRLSNKINLLILDEAFKDLSFESMNKIIDLLNRLNKKIILVEHNEMIRSVVDNVVKVELKNGKTKLV